MRSVLLGAAVAALGSKTHAQDLRPKALVYRGPSTCDGCPESLGQLLETSPFNFTVQYAGPEENINVTEQSLSGVRVFAFPGGPSLDDAYEETKPYATAIRNYVAGGGNYLGVCLGAFLAGPSQGFGIVPPGAEVGEEIYQPNSEVTNGNDTTIYTSYTFADGRTTTRKVYFQDGAYISGIDDTNGKVVARYTYSNDTAATLNSYGQGRVGLIGVHTEADDSWYSAANVSNVAGLSFDMGWDFISQLMLPGPVSA